MTDVQGDARLRQLLELGRTVVSDLDLDSVLKRITQAAVDLTGARYGALGVLDEARVELERFITVGVTDEERRAIGDPPRGRGVLGVLIRDPRPLRLDDVGSHPESFGFGIGHPAMRSFLGVPIRTADGRVFGNLYLTEKQGAASFSRDDEELLVALSDWAGVAISNARRFGGVSGRRNELERAVHAFETTSEISRALAGETELDRIIELIVKRSRPIVNARATMIALLDGDDLVVEAVAGAGTEGLRGHREPVSGSFAGRALESGRPARVHPLPASAALGREIGARSELLVPLRFRGVRLGVLAAFDRLDGSGAFDPNDERLLDAFASSAAPAVATAQTVASDRLRRSIEAAERERTRWARELHDETLQDLAAIKTLLAAARRGGDADRLASAVETALEQLQIGITGLRSLITELRPAALDQLGPAAALEALVRRITTMASIEIRLDVDIDYEAGRADTRHTPEIEATIYRIVQEALTNVIKHADATSAEVVVRERDDEVDIVVRDDGRGVGEAPGGGGFGLTGMRERAALSGGTLEIGPGEGCGTVVHAVLPAQRRAPTEPTGPVGDLRRRSAAGGG